MNENTEGRIRVIVHSPRTPHPKTFHWLTTMVVGDAAKEAAREFGYEAGNPGLQNRHGLVLDNAQTLDQARVRDGDELELVDTGGGV